MRGQFEKGKAKDKGCSHSFFRKKPLPETACRWLKAIRRRCKGSFCQPLEEYLISQPQHVRSPCGALEAGHRSPALAKLVFIRGWEPFQDDSQGPVVYLSASSVEDAGDKNRLDGSQPEKT